MIYEGSSISNKKKLTQTTMAYVKSTQQALKAYNKLI